MSNNIYDDNQCLIQEATEALEEMSFLIDSDPELIESMLVDDVEREMRAIGLDPNKPCISSSPVDHTQLQANLSDFQPGDIVRVHVRSKGSETTERIQAFEGVVIFRKGGGTDETIVVRKTTFGVGVERTFPLHTGIVDHIEVVKKARVGRAKLYYRRGQRDKAARIGERNASTPRDKIGQEKRPS